MRGILLFVLQAAATVLSRTLYAEGLKSDNTSALRSSVCSAGMYLSSTGSCLSCQPGTYSTAQKASVCTNCIAGTYLSATAGTSCSVCPQGSTSPARSTSPTDCVCMDGYGPQYGFLSAGVDTSSTCTPPSVITNSRGQICQFPYYNNENLIWIIAAPDASTKVSLSLTSLATEDGYDYIYIDGCADSTCAETWSIVSWTGSLSDFYINNPTDIVKVTTRVVRVNFVSDASNTGSGWSILWQFVSVQCVPCAPGTYALSESEDPDSDLFVGHITSSQVVQAMTPCSSCPPNTISPPLAPDILSCQSSPGYLCNAGMELGFSQSSSQAGPQGITQAGVLLQEVEGVIDGVVQIGYLTAPTTASAVIAPPDGPLIDLDFAMLSTAGTSSTVSVFACADTSCAAGTRTTLLNRWQGSLPPSYEIWAESGVMRVEIEINDLYWTGQPKRAGFVATWSSVPAKCWACGAGTYASNIAAGSCLPCGSGTFAAGGGSACMLCSPGTFARGAASACTPCLPGTFATETGSETCDVCAAGTYGAAVGTSNECTACTAGFYSAATAATTCAACSAGSISENAGSTTCSECGAGLFSTADAATACAECIAGTFAGTATACSACGPGEYATAVGATSGIVCLECSAGTFASTEVATTCGACAPGSFAAAAGRAMCDACAPGTFSNTSETTTCTSCQMGAFSGGLGGTECGLCLAGSYAGSEGASTCDLCPPGSVGAVDGSHECVACLAGEFASASGGTSCVQCLAGEFAPAVGATVCLLCQPGTIAAGDGATACVLCPAGSYSNATQGSCSACPMGSFCMGGGVPQPCPTNTIGNISGGSSAAACTPCPAGSWSPTPGQTRCEVKAKSTIPDTTSPSVAAVAGDVEVQLTVTLALSRDSFLSVEPQFIIAVALAAEVSTENVVVLAISDSGGQTRRSVHQRLLLEAGVVVVSAVWSKPSQAAAVVASLSDPVLLGDSLVTQGLPRASSIAASTIVAGPTYTPSPPPEVVSGNPNGPVGPSLLVIVCAAAGGGVALAAVTTAAVCFMRQWQRHVKDRRRAELEMLDLTAANSTSDTSPSAPAAPRTGHGQSGTSRDGVDLLVSPGEVCCA